MQTLKHIGKIKSTAAKVIVVFRTLPGASDQCLILPTATLPDAYHDSIMSLVESDVAQEAFEFGEMMFMRMFPDGRPMLQAMQADSRLLKMSTSDIIMTPAPQTDFALDQLNVLIAEQKNCAVDELCTFVKGGSAGRADQSNEKPVVKEAPVAPVVAATNEVLSDTDIAKSYRSQADSMYKEAARLRKEADALDPPKAKKATKTTETAVDA